MKVSIVGAGPAGSTAALFLARAGFETELIDRCEFPRDKPCAGGLFNPLLYYRDFPWLEEARGKTLYKARFSFGRHKADFVSKTPLMKTFMRKELDHLILKKALEAGARFTVGKEPDGDVLIDASGARNPNDYPKCGICLVNDFETDSGLDEGIDTVHVHYGFMGIVGYCWLYPKYGHVSVGVGAYTPQRNIREVYRRFLELLSSEGIVDLGRNEARSVPYRAKIIPFAPRKSFHGGGTLIAGDAAGFVNPSTGEGIYFAMLSGKLAALSVIEARPPQWYEEQCRKAFGVWLKPARFENNRELLLKVLERAIEMSSRDERFMTMIAENYFRLGHHGLAGRFLKNLIFGGKAKPRRGS